MNRGVLLAGLRCQAIHSWLLSLIVFARFFLLCLCFLDGVENKLSAGYKVVSLSVYLLLLF
jgi:hypothetical protein